MVDRVVDEAVEEAVNIPSPHLCVRRGVGKDYGLASTEKEMRIECR
jgi:hypothetical protein